MSNLYTGYVWLRVDQLTNPLYMLRLVALKHSGHVY